MRHMKNLVLVSILACSATANAEAVEADTGMFNIALGLKWSPLRYTHPLGVAPVDAPAYYTLQGWQTTSLDNYIGFFFHPQIGIVLGLDIGYSSAHVDDTGNNTKTGYDTSFFQFGFALGGKFYLTRPTGQRVSPYLYVDFYKYFASISGSGSDNYHFPPGDQVGWLAGRLSPVGASLALGAEYFFTSSFSLGAEVFGFRVAYTEGDYTVAGVTHTNKDTYFTLYTAITLNYRFLASASVRLEAEDEDSPRPAKRRPKPRRPAPPSDETPAPSPESVD